MMNATPKESQYKNHPLIFITLMGVYLLMVFSWTLTIHPMGRDYLRMGEMHSLSMPIEAFLGLEMALFGDWTPGYHGVNLLLLYAVMIALFFYTRFTIRGPWWLGSLTAVLLMANPLKSEAVLGLSGSCDLLGALTALTALALYGAHSERPRLWKYLLSLLFFLLAVTCFASNRLLILVLIAHEGLITTPEDRQWRRMIPFLFLTVFDPWFLVLVREWPSYDPVSFWTPLYLVFYPIGLLPETVAMIYSTHWYFYGAVLLMALLMWLVAKQAKRKAFVFGLLGAVALRLYCWDEPVDLVHQIGGATMLLPIALLNIAFAALCLSVMQHPKWRKPVVMLTTLLCIVFFLLQAQMNLTWMKAGKQVKAFQETAEALPWEGEARGVIPDFQYLQGAPLCLSSAVQHDTPYSKKHPAFSLLPIHDLPRPGIQAQLLEQSESYALLKLQGAKIAQLCPDPYVGALTYASLNAGETLIHFSQQREDVVLVRVVSKTGALPATFIPWRLETK